MARHGGPRFILLAVDDLEAIEETMFWRAQPEVAVDVAAGRAEADADELNDEAAVRRRYGVGSAR